MYSLWLSDNTIVNLGGVVLGNKGRINPTNLPTKRASWRRFLPRKQG
jgi:hypothetical protein